MTTASPGWDQDRVKAASRRSLEEWEHRKLALERAIAAAPTRQVRRQLERKGLR